MEGVIKLGGCRVKARVGLPQPLFIYLFLAFPGTFCFFKKIIINFVELPFKPLIFPSFLNPPLFSLSLLSNPSFPHKINSIPPKKTQRNEKILNSLAEILIFERGKQREMTPMQQQQ